MRKLTFRKPRLGGLLARLRRRKPAPPGEQAGLDAVAVIMARNGGAPVPRSRSLAVPGEDPMDIVRAEVASKIERRKAATGARRARLKRLAKLAAIALGLSAAGGAVYAAHSRGYIDAAVKTAWRLHARAIAALPQFEAARPQPAAEKTAAVREPARPAATCAAEPDQDGCFTGNVVRQGAFLCQDGPRPLALEFASSPIRSAMGLSHRDHVAPSTGFATILPTTTRVNYITKDLRIPIDIVAFHRDGRIAAIIKDVPARRQMPVALPAADGIVALRAGEAQRLRLSESCQFAAYEEGVPMPPLSAEVPQKGTGDKRLSANSQ